MALIPIRLQYCLTYWSKEGIPVPVMSWPTNPKKKYSIVMITRTDATSTVINVWFTLWFGNGLPFIIHHTRCGPEQLNVRPKLPHFCLHIMLPKFSLTFILHNTGEKYYTAQSPPRSGKSLGITYCCRLPIRSCTGLPRVDSSQSRTATTSIRSGWKIKLSILQIGIAISKCRSGSGIKWDSFSSCG